MFTRPVRRIVAGLAGLVGLAVLVLGVEVQLARMGPRLDDDEGERPEGLLIGEGDGDPVSVVWLGDSTTTGVGADDFTDSMAHRVADEVSDSLDRPVALTVLGVSGDQVHEVLDGQVDDVPPSTDVVLISIGANDVTALTRETTFRKRYAELLRRLEAGAAPDAELVLLGVPDMGAVPRFAQPLRAIAGWRGEVLDDVIEDLASDRDLRYVDLEAQTGPTFRDDPRRYFAADDFHPSSEGHGLWADAVADAAIAAASTATG